MNPLLLFTIARYTAALGAGFFLAWQIQAHFLIKQELNHANERISQQRAARANLERVTLQLSKAQTNAANRGISNRAAAVDSGNAAGGLRIATDTAVRTAAGDPAACADTTAALGAVLTASVKEYRELAETCDRHVSDIQTLTEAWPSGN
ncbi:MAG: hypothetical protein WC829_09890 [Hyphomicrobium sp.]|jgi:hypothetical protein